MFQFTDDCLIGVPEIDNEHRKLFELISAANTALQANDDAVTQALVLINELKHYAATHFAHEEAYMEQIRDPELPRQRVEHSAFINKINSYSLSDINNEASASVILELLDFLSRWLLGHILGSDILIGQFQSNPQPDIPVFDDTYRTGIALIDEEHQMLFDIIGQIHTTIQTELVHDKYDAIMDIVQELTNYTRIHFADEEKYMLEIGYEGLARQQLLHRRFIDKLNELDLNDIDDNQESYLYDFLSFLQNWLINHILKVDKLIPVQ